MQKPNFPNQVIRVTASPGDPLQGHPKVRLVGIPAKFNAKSVSTLSGRRIALDKLGKFDTFSRGFTNHIVVGYARDRAEADKLAEKMLNYLRAQAQKDVEDLQRIQLGLRFEPKVTEDEYKD